MRKALIFLLLTPLILQSQDFHLGADLSYVNQMEDCGAVYTQNGIPADPYSLFAANGCTMVRVRKWHNPQAWAAYPTSYSSYEDVTETISRARAEGMKVMLDFHFSDTWADPSKQYCPAAWEAVADDYQILSDSIYNYTYKTLIDLDALGLMPEMVQLGNEINVDICVPYGEAQGGLDWSRQAQLLNAAIQAVRDADDDSDVQPQIILHKADPNWSDGFFSQLLGAGVTDFDIAGLSYYPQWHTGDIDDTAQRLDELHGLISRPSMLVEVGLPWTMTNADPANNILSQVPDGFSPASAENQKAWLDALTSEVQFHNCAGVIYWEPAWVSTNCQTEWGTGSHYDNATFFDEDGDLIQEGGIGFFAQDYLELSEVNASALDVYPNPHEGILYINSQEQMKFRLIDPLGRTLSTGTIAIGSNTLSIGAYESILVIEAYNARSSSRFILLPKK